MVIAGAGEEGGRLLDVETIICCGGAGGPSVLVKNVGYVTAHWEEYEMFPPQSGLEVYRVSVKEDYGQEVVLPPTFE